MPREADLKARPNGKDLSNLCEDAAEASPLDFLHVTEVGSARAILLGRPQQFDAKRCDVFQGNRVYFFLGRADYRRATWDADTDDITAFPVAFVLDHRKMPEPAYVYPLDTGAASRGYFATRGVSDYVRLEDLRLQDMATARRHIARCFGDATRYVAGQLDPRCEPKPGDPNWIDSTFQKMARVPAQAANAPDRRASAVEVAYTTHIPLEGRLRMIVLPSVLQDDGYEEIHTALDNINPSGSGVRTEYYDWLPDRPPAMYMDAIQGLIEQYLADEGQIDPT